MIYQRGCNENMTTTRDKWISFECECARCINNACITNKVYPSLFCKCKCHSPKNTEQVDSEQVSERQEGEEKVAINSTTSSPSLLNLSVIEKQCPEVLEYYISKSKISELIEKCVTLKHDRNLLRKELKL